MQRYVLFGKGGQLADALLRADPTIHGLTIDDANITSIYSCEKYFAEIKPSVVLNCAAYNKVDDAEDEPEVAWRVNALGPRNLALLCAKYDCTLVHYSTNYVFDGTLDRPYRETDEAKPLGAYHLSKRDGEIFVEQKAPKHYIFRTAALYGPGGSVSKGGATFVSKVLEKARREEQLRIVDDQSINPTLTDDLAVMTLALLEKQPDFGIYHLTNAGVCSWYEFARRACEMAGLQADIVPVKTTEFKTKARRPLNGALDLTKALALCTNIPDWETALARFISIATAPAA